MIGTASAPARGASVADSPAPGPPRWLVLVTVAATLGLLAISVAETTLWMHFVVDRGESISLAGLAFIFVAGLGLHRQGRLRRSLPLVLPWVLYPVVTQGDQLIDHLSIGWMRLIVHAILALLFGGPVAVIVLAAGQSRALRASSRRERGALLAIALLAAEVVVAHYYLGTLMVITLVVMLLGTCAYLWAVMARPGFRLLRVGGARADRLALAVLVGGCALSLALYVGYKNRPGAYQGSPHYYHDPSQRDAAYPMSAVPVPRGAAPLPATVAADVRGVLAEYGAVLEELLAAYYVMDRNYNYWFHNELFLRHTPVQAGFREASLARIAAARERATAADKRLDRLRGDLPSGHLMRAFADEAAAYVHFNLRRAAILERMTAGFQQTKAGLQHATHLYEGEGKAIGAVLAGVLAKHQRTLDDPALAPIAAGFVDAARRVREAYANRIVGF